MSCLDCQRHMHAFLDNELDAGLSMQIQEHLDRCPTCAREAAIEIEISKKLRIHLTPEIDEDAVIERLMATTGEPIRVVSSGRMPRRWRRRWPAIAIAAAAMVLLAVGIQHWWAASKAGNHLAQVLVADHVKMASGKAPLEFVSSDAAAVTRWVEGRLALRVKVPAGTGDDVGLLGARKCVLNGRPAAFLLCEHRGVPISMIVFDGADVDFGEWSAFEQKEGLLMGECQGYGVVVRCTDSLVYCLVSERPCRELAVLMP